MAGEGTSYEQQGGGAGGKFRKRPFRSTQTTPYDRPIRNPRDGWLAKLVDPASKLISASSHMFFSSVFRKRLPPPPLLPPHPSPGANCESMNVLQVREVVVPNNPPGAQESPVNDDEGKPINSSDNSGISELEQMLKKKTFTRAEIDRLTGLLHSRTSDLHFGDVDRSTKPNISKPVAGFERQEGFASSSIKENGFGSHGLNGDVSSPVASSRVVEEDVASPAELAKAYMGNRPLELSPSMIGRSPAPKEDVTLFDNAAPFSSKSPIMSVASKSAVGLGVPGSGFTTPRSRGRSAIYSMARTPYSSVHVTANQMGTGYTNVGNGGPSSSLSRFALEHNGDVGRFGSKQVVLKRRSSVLDEDIGSVGPVRRIRQKPNLLSSKGLSLPVTGSPLSSHAMEVGPHAAQQKLLLLDKHKHKVSKMRGEDEADNIHSTSFAFVPSKSTETATKILQHLEKSTPKEKSSEFKLAAARDKSPAKLTQSMLSGKALRSLEHVDSSKFLQNVKDSCKLEVSHIINSADAGVSSTSQKQEKIKENGPTTLVASCYTLATPTENTVDTKVPVKDAAAPSINHVDSASVSQPPQKIRAFQMSAHEDSVELDDDDDDDFYLNEDAHTMSAKGREKLEMPMVESKSKAVVTEPATTLVMNPAFLKVKPLVGSELDKRSDLEANDGSVTGENRSGFTFPSGSMTLHTPQSTSAFDKNVPSKEPNIPAMHSFGSENVNKIPTFKFPASSALVSESSLLKSSASSDADLESSNGFPNAAVGATDAVLKSPKSDKDDKNENGDIVGKSETVSCSASTSISAASSIFSFGATANTSVLNNGSLASSPFTVSSSAPYLPSNSDNGNKNSTEGSMRIASSTNTATAAVPSFFPTPIFSVGSSVASPVSVSVVSTISDVQNTDLKAKAEETNFGSINSLTFGGGSSATASTGSGIFGFSAPAISSTASNQPQGSLFGSGTGSLGGTQVSSAGTSDATITQTMPVQFGSSQVFTGTTTLTSNSSMFGSSTPDVSILFSSGTSFGGMSSASVATASQTNSVSSTSSGGVTSDGLFGSNWQPTTKSPSIFGGASSSSTTSTTSLFNSQSPSPSTGFSFGGGGASSSSTTSVTATNGAPTMVFGSPGSIFSFTSAAANNNNNNNTHSLSSFSQTQPLFGNSTSGFFSPSSGNGDQMNMMEDSMAEDHPVQASSLSSVSLFGQPPPTISPPSSSPFKFGSSAPGINPFHFGSLPNQATPQNPFQASGSLDFSAGGSSFSLGTGGDKANRRTVKVKKNRKK